MKRQAKIQYKILLVVIPILVLTSAFIGFTSYYSARNGITSVAKEFLGFKLNNIYDYVSRQYAVIRDMNLQNDPSLLDNTRTSVIEYTKTLINTPTGIFFALKTNGGLEFGTISNLTESDNAELMKSIGGKNSGWIESAIAGHPMVGVFIQYSDWGVNLVIMDRRDTFYANANAILNYVLIILAFSLVLAGGILLYFITRTMAPVKAFVSTIEEISVNMDMTKRVKIVYNDEIGYLAFSFNNMIAELESAYNQIKNYAYQTVLAKKKEERIRFIFQKYVPSEVINQILNIPFDSMLIGSRQKVTILFSDIRSFTTISESLKAEELVLSLNNYFSRMGDVISRNKGEIDKFIGDAIMAIFGAPVAHENDAELSVLAAIGMVDALVEFNNDQDSKGKVNFQIGVGINTGDAIVGNIGSEKKVNYTVIGDTVNLASRLEGLTKKYHARVIISQFTKEAIRGQLFYYRELDNVRVKGKNEPVKIYEPFLLDAAKPMLDYYQEFHSTLELYYQGHFREALKRLERHISTHKEDYLSYLYKERCEYLIANPPEKWDGVETWSEK